MKKILAFLLVAIMVVALVACGGDKKDTTTAKDATETTATENQTTAETTTATEKQTTEETTTVETTTTEEVTTTEETTTVAETTTAVVIEVDPTDPASVIAAAYQLEAGETLAGAYTLQGIVTKIGTAYNPQYGNVTVTIAVGGDESKLIDAYRAQGEDAQAVKVGDEVIVSGKIKNYKGTVEFDAGCSIEIVPTVTELEGIICDVGYSGGKIVDSKGLLTFPASANEYVDNYSVYVDDAKYKVPAFVVFEVGTAAIGTFESVKTTADYLNLFNKDFSVEVYYFNNNTSGGDSVQAVFCSTEFGGWGIAENAGKPYFIIGLNSGGKNTYASVYALNTSSNKNLTHVVATFSKTEGVMRIYVNGVLDAETKFDGTLDVMPPNTDNTLKTMIIGADIDGNKDLKHEHNGEFLEFRTAEFQLIDAKIYDHALTAPEAKMAFELDQAAVVNP